MHGIIVAQDAELGAGAAQQQAVAVAIDSYGVALAVDGAVSTVTIDSQVLSGATGLRATHWAMGPDVGSPGFRSTDGGTVALNNGSARTIGGDGGLGMRYGSQAAGENQ